MGVDASGDVVELYVDALATFGEAVRDVADHEWDLPTPCSDWNVRDVVAHVVMGEAQLPLVLSGETTSTGAAFGSEILGAQPLLAWRGTALKAIEAAKVEGVADKVFDLDVGAVDGQQLLGYRITDNVVHAWDLSVGVGRPQPIADHRAEWLLDFWLPAGLATGNSAFFSVPTEPVSDSPSDRLLALLGRIPPVG